MLAGTIDLATRDRISGWARDSEAPDTAVSLLITVDDVLLTRVLADRLREDLREAGYGTGRHGFEVALQGLSPIERHRIEVRREHDGAHLDGSPVLVEPASRFDGAFRIHFAALLADIADDADLTERLGFLAEQAEALLQLRASRRSRRAERIAQRQIKWRWTGPEPGVDGPPPGLLPPRALFIDEVVPRSSRDAGSNAVLSHMRALQRLGFEVVFAAADMGADRDGTLEEAGIACCQAPWHGSVEEVLRREAECFDLVYLHRATIASRYLALARFHQPKARLVFSVADLHHLRLARQARAEDRPELVALAKQYQAIELRMAAASNAVITHSTYEAALLRQQLPSLAVHVVPWAIPVRETAVPFGERHGIAFIGHYGHAPNVDAAQWLIDEIMPRVRQTHPAITCRIVGSDMPELLRRDVAGIEPVGAVGALSQVFDRVRLTVAPMSYGAGIKGKVLESLAAGIPCVCTPIAAEGLELPPQLRDLVAEDAAGLAQCIIRVHEDAAFNAECRAAGLAYVAAALAESRIDTLMRAVAALPAGPAA